MNPVVNLVLCLLGIVAMIFAAMPAFSGKYVVTEASLEALRNSGMPPEVADQIRTGLGGREFLYTFTLDAALHRALGADAAGKYRSAVHKASSAPLAVKDLGGIALLFFVALGFWAWAYKQPLRRPC
ncbi:MAG: hypothetical protein FJW34_10400 [Acidobacteria bacterium]|nr:hypothetical protein [Acidobacteriota bacterium]